MYIGFRLTEIKILDLLLMELMNKYVLIIAFLIPHFRIKETHLTIGSAGQSKPRLFPSTIHIFCPLRWARERNVHSLQPAPKQKEQSELHRARSNTQPGFTQRTSSSQLGEEKERGQREGKRGTFKDPPPVTLSLKRYDIRSFQSWCLLWSGKPDKCWAR